MPSVLIVEDDESMAVALRDGFEYEGYEVTLARDGAAGLRLVLMLLPVNEWSSTVPPQPWSTIRNLPLMLQGLGLAYLMLRDARAARDRVFTWIGVSILVSYACYIPVIFFVQQAPMVGMLMIPKTMAYVAIGFLAYFDLYGRQSSAVKDKQPAGQAVG